MCGIDGHDDSNLDAVVEDAGASAAADSSVTTTTAWAAVAEGIDSSIDFEAVQKVLYDSHCHVQMGVQAGGHEAADAASNIDSGMAIMSTSEDDWAQVEALAMTKERNISDQIETSNIGSDVSQSGNSTGSISSDARSLSQVTVAYGVHPWWAHRTVEGWYERLQERLVADSAALVGEIGLDKVSRTPETGKCEIKTQEAVFRQQIEMAGRLDRPASVHCVKAFGRLVEVLDSVRSGGGELPPAIAMHSYGGSPDFVRVLLSHEKKGGGAQAGGSDFYFGFSYAVCAGDERRRQRLLSNLEAVPDDRLLLETDRENPSLVDPDMIHICGLVAKAKGWSFEETARVGDARSRPQP